jgi:hypothetical protein
LTLEKIKTKLVLKLLNSNAEKFYSPNFSLYDGQKFIVQGNIIAFDQLKVIRQISQQNQRIIFEIEQFEEKSYF